LIATPEGPRAVETLAIADLVLTHDSLSSPPRWIGRNTVSTRFADPLRVLLIRIKAGALVNGVSIVRETDVPATCVYSHGELPKQSLILAEGMPAETFVDNVERMAFDNWPEYQALYGDIPVDEMDLPRAKAHRQAPPEPSGAAVEAGGGDLRRKRRGGVETDRPRAVFADACPRLRGSGQGKRARQGKVRTERIAVTLWIAFVLPPRPYFKPRAELSL
jgi:hypothetical protein